MEGQQYDPEICFVFIVLSVNITLNFLKYLSLYLIQFYFIKSVS